MNDFPDFNTKTGNKKKVVKAEDSSDEEGLPTPNKKITWACFICTTNNQPETKECVTCWAPWDYVQSLK